jgi:leucyl aminopeptidase
MIPTSTNVTVTTTAKLPADAEAVALFCPEDAKPDKSATTHLPADVVQSIDKLLSVKVAKGKARELATDLIQRRGAVLRLLVAGVGPAPKLTLQSIRESAAVVARHCARQSISRVALIVSQTDRLSPEEVAGAAVEGFLLASFKYTEYRGTAQKKQDPDEAAPKPLRLILVSSTRIDAPVRQAQVLADAQNFARTIAFRPGNDINPLTLAKVAQQTAKDAGLQCRILDEKQMQKLGMGGMLGVGMGAIDTPPRMIVLEHKPARAKRRLLLVGKAITFDTGGISIKPSEKMGRMVFDKCGGMAVLGAMVAAARLKLPVHVVGILAAAENHISQRAYRPGDILRMHNGVTVEVTNTDAEGRLVLGDALAWGIKTYRPQACLDLATLTGGVLVALGRSMAGVMGNDQKLVDRLTELGKREGEKMWQLPLPEEPQEMLKSDYADIVNSGGREAHPLQGAAFLSFFVPQDPLLPWAHLDIAGVADTERELPLYGKGATGWGVRTLVKWLEAGE